MSAKARRAPARNHRSNAFVGLFQAVREGAFIGSFDPAGATGDATLAANPYLKSIFGYPADVPEEQVAPFAPDRFWRW